MPQTLTVSEIANMIGVEEVIIRHTLERRDEDLLPYLHDQSPDASGEGEIVSTSTDRAQTPLLDFEGLPLLIRKVAVNIPTLDIIENLACQVVHLMVVQAENAELAVTNQELQKQNKQQQRQTQKLQQKIEMLQTQLAEQAEAATRKGFWNIFKRRETKDT